MSICLSCTYNKYFFWMYPCKDCVHMGGYENNYRQLCSSKIAIPDKAKGEIDMANYLFSGEEIVKPGEKLNFGRSNGKTFYSIISGPMKIKNVIFNYPATIVFWGDGTKTVVKCGKNDAFDPEKGLAMAISKKLYGNKGNYYNIIKKWLPKDYKVTDEESKSEHTEDIVKLCANCRFADNGPLDEPCAECISHISKDHINWEPENGK